MDYQQTLEPLYSFFLPRDTAAQGGMVTDMKQFFDLPTNTPQTCTQKHNMLCSQAPPTLPTLAVCTASVGNVGGACEWAGPGSEATPRYLTLE